MEDKIIDPKLMAPIEFISKGFSGLLKRHFIGAGKIDEIRAMTDGSQQVARPK
jgi:hypothetical protein